MSAWRFVLKRTALQGNCIYHYIKSLIREWTLEQLCYECSPKHEQWRKFVPYIGYYASLLCNDVEWMSLNGGDTCPWNVVVHHYESQYSDTLLIMGKVLWRHAGQDTVDKKGKTKLNPVWNSQPMQIAMQWRHVFNPSCQVDHSCCCIENRMESVQLPCWQHRQCSTAIVESVETMSWQHRQRSAALVESGETKRNKRQ